MPHVTTIDHHRDVGPDLAFGREQPFAEGRKTRDQAVDHVPHGGDVAIGEHHFAPTDDGPKGGVDADIHGTGAGFLLAGDAEFLQLASRNDSVFPAARGVVLVLHQIQFADRVLRGPGPRLLQEALGK